MNAQMKTPGRILTAWFLIMMNLSASAAVNSIRIKITGNSSWDETGIRFMAGATPAFDGMYDAWKLMSPNPNVPQLFTKISPTEKLSINSLPEFDRKQTVDLFTRIAVPGVYSFSCVEVNVFDSTVCIYIEDLQNGQLYDLRTTNSYSFSLTAATESTPPRFRVHFIHPASITAFDAMCAQSFDGSVIINKGGDSTWSYQLYNPMGNMIASGTNVNEADTVYLLGTGTHTVNITTVYGCPESFSFYIGESAPVAAGFITSDTMYYLSQSNVQFTDASVNAGYYIWDFGDSTALNFQQNPLHQFAVSGTYSVKQTVSNGSCNDVMIKTIHIIPDVTTSVAENNSANSVNAYFDGSNIVISGRLDDLKASIINIAGQVVATVEPNDSHAVNMNDSADGYYMVVIETNGKRIIKKVAVIR